MKTSTLRTMVFAFFTTFILLLSSSYAAGVSLNQNPCFRSLLRITLNERTGNLVRDQLNDRDSFEPYGIPEGDPRYPLRRTLVAMAKDREIRRGLLVPALKADLKERSRLLSDRLTEASKSKEVDETSQVWDLVNIGASVHDVAIQLALKEQNPELKTITVTSGEEVAEVFAKEGFRVNSSIGIDRLGEPPVPRQERNLNQIPGALLQTSDVSNAKYIEAKDLADVALINRATIESPLLFGHTVSKVEDNFLSTDPSAPNWPARYRITFENGNKIWTNAIVNTGGLGTEPNLKKFSAEAQTLIARERNTSDGKTPAKIQTATEFFNTLYNDPKAFRNYMTENGKAKGKKQRIAVIGQGDSANTVFESLLGFGPEGSYGLSTASDGKFEEAYWYGQDKTTCEAFLNSARNRYSDVGTGLRGKVKAVPQGAVDIQKNEDGTFTITNSSNETQIVDRVIIASGFEDKIAEVYEPITQAAKNGDVFNDKNPLKESGYLFPVTGQVPTLEGTVKIGKQLKNPRNSSRTPDQKIYFSGPGAGKLAEKAELEGVGANDVSLFVLSKRSRELALKVGTLLKNAGNKRLAQIPEPEKQVLTSSNDNVVVNYLLERTKENSQTRFSKPYDDILLKSRLSALLNSFILPYAQNEIKINRTKDGNFVIGLSGLTRDSGLAVAKKIQSDTELMELINDRIGGKNEYDTLAFETARRTNFFDGAQTASLKIERSYRNNIERENLATNAENAKSSKFNKEKFSKPDDKIIIKRFGLPSTLRAIGSLAAINPNVNANAQKPSQIAFVTKKEPVLEGMLKALRSQPTAKSVSRFLLSPDPEYRTEGFIAFDKLSDIEKGEVISSEGYKKQSDVARSEFIAKLSARPSKEISRVLEARKKTLDYLKQVDLESKAIEDAIRNVSLAENNLSSEIAKLFPQAVFVPFISTIKFGKPLSEYLNLYTKRTDLSLNGKIETVKAIFYAAKKLSLPESREFYQRALDLWEADIGSVQESVRQQVIDELKSPDIEPYIKGFIADISGRSNLKLTNEEREQLKALAIVDAQNAKKSNSNILVSEADLRNRYPAAQELGPISRMLRGSTLSEEFSRILNTKGYLEKEQVDTIQAIIAVANTLSKKEQREFLLEATKFLNASSGISTIERQARKEIKDLLIEELEKRSSDKIYSALAKNLLNGPINLEKDQVQRLLVIGNTDRFKKEKDKFDSSTVAADISEAINGLKSEVKEKFPQSKDLIEDSQTLRGRELGTEFAFSLAKKTGLTNQQILDTGKAAIFISTIQSRIDTGSFEPRNMTCDLAWVLLKT